MAIRFFILSLCLCQTLLAETLALYLSWYADPTTTMAIQWHTPIAQESEDTISLIKPNGKKQSFTGTCLPIGTRLVHHVLLEQLNPDTEYTFQIPQDPAVYKFRTAPKILKTPLRFVIGGDADHTQELFEKMNSVIAKRDPLFAVIGGDVAYAISSNPFRLRSTSRNRWFSFLDTWKKQMIAPDGRIIPFILVAGNHDISMEESDLFFELFAYPQKQLYRTIDFGNYLSLVLLDTGHLDPIEGKQTAWLDQALKERKSFSHLIPIYHIGAFPSYYSYTGETPKKIRELWCPLFEKHTTRCAFEHHNHAFKRTHPIRNGVIDPTGVVYLGDGCWGAVPRQPTDLWYLAKSGQENNVYVMEASPQSLKIEAIGLEGELLDRLQLPQRNSN